MENYKKCFAENLRRQRQKLGLTQSGLAELLGFSEKTVSKWEREASIPDIATLFKLCGLLHISFEHLFSSDDEVYFLGIDGGGTKTEFLLSDREGNTVRSLRSDCCNPIDIGIDAAQRILRTGIETVCEGYRMASVILFAGIAGGTSADMRPRLTTFFADFGFRSFTVDSDNMNILSAGLLDADGITLILGTGICSYSKVGGEIRRVGGWGYLIDDGGSAYNIGRDGLAAVFRAQDGSGEETLLTEEIEKMYPDGTTQLLGQLYEERKKLIASFAPAVYRAAREHDGVAERILRANMAFAAKVIGTSGKRFPGGVRIPVVIAGGLTHEELTLTYLKAALGDPERYELKILDRAPVGGAVRLAMKMWEKEREQ